MAIYSLGIATTVTTSAAPALDVLAASGTRPRLLEFVLINAAATQSNYNFGISGNTNVVQSAPTLLQAEDPGDPAGKTNVAVAWTTAPTIPTTIYRFCNVQASISAGNIWSFPYGLVLPTTGASLVLWNRQANSANMHVTIVVDE